MARTNAIAAFAALVVALFLLIVLLVLGVVAGSRHPDRYPPWLRFVFTVVPQPAFQPISAMRSKWVEVLRPEIWEVVLGEEEALEMGGKESEDGRKAEDWQPIHLHLLDPPPPPSTIPMLKPKHNRRSPSSSPPALTRPDPLDECRPSSVALSIFVRPPTPPTDSNNTSTILRHGELDELELGDLDFEIGTTILPLAGGVAGAEELQGLLVLI